MRKNIGSIALFAAALLGASGDTPVRQEEIYTGRTQPLTAKQKRTRKASKNARKARKLNRKHL